MEAGVLGLRFSVRAFMAFFFVPRNLSDGVRRVRELSESVG
jgi:hypothetical protein